MTKDRKKPYTLIEIVTVIAIAAIVITLIGVSFENLGGSSNVDAATAEVGNALSLAQSQAASRRRYVAVVIATPATTASSTKLADRSFSAYRLAYVEKPNGGSADFVSWVPAQDWKLLPLGTAVITIDGEAADANYGGKALTINDVDKKGRAGAGLVFSSKGTLYPAATSNCQIIVGSAMLDDNGDMVFQGAAADRLRITINKYTGVISYDAAP